MATSYTTFNSNLDMSGYWKNAVDFAWSKQAENDETDVFHVACGIISFVLQEHVQITCSDSVIEVYIHIYKYKILYTYISITRYVIEL